MQFDMTAEELQANQSVLSILLAKLLAKVRWNALDLDHEEMQWLLDNDKNIKNAVLYSPVKTQAVLDADVPVDINIWPRSSATVDEVTRQLTFGEYLRITAVTGGFCLQYAGGPKNIATNSIPSLPNNSQLRAQIVIGGGFLTQGEVDLIKTVPEG